MRTVVVTGPGVVELAYTWLPTWIGINASLKKEIEAALAEGIVGRALTEEVLDQIHEEVVDFLAKRFPYIEGLRDYLDSLKFVQVNPHHEEQDRPAPSSPR